MRLLGKLLTSPSRVAPPTDSAVGSSPETPVVRSPQELGEVSALVARATAYESQGRYPESLSLINEALVAAPEDPNLLAACGATLYAWGRYWEAREAFQRAEAGGLRSARLYRMWGFATLQTGRAAEAEGLMRKAVAAAPAEWAMHLGLAAALRALRQFSEAVAAYERALALAPNSIECLMDLAACALDLRDPVAAEAYGRRAIAVDPERAVAWANLGVAIGRQDRYSEAFDAFERALELEARPGEQCDSFVNFANCMRDVGRTQDALDLYERSLAERPNLYGYGDYAVTLMTAGRLLEGWNYYEFRWMQEPLNSIRPRFAKPVWDGQDLRDKTIVLRVEQGFGDIVQFVRYAPYLKAMGATVVLQVRTGIDEMAAAFPGVDRVMYRDEPIQDYDFYIHLMSLPRAFGTDLASIPDDVPYIFPDPVRVEQWAKRVSNDNVLKVGLAWAGNPGHQRDRYRSIPFNLLEPLWDVDRVRFYSLQKGPQAADVAKVPKEVDFVDLGPCLEDFADTAAAISQLDMVLCVDTAVAHIAGAMGKPVWVLLANPADYRWLEQREDSPWYPTMRLFRQDRLGDWERAIAAVKAALEARLEEPKSVQRRRPLRTEAPSESAVLSMPSIAARTAMVPAGFCLATETRVGILQYLPREPIVGESLAWYGEFLQPQLDLLSRIVTPDATVMEVGAGIGTHAIFLARRVEAAGHLFLYEPQQVLRRILQQNLAANGIANATIMTLGIGGVGQVAGTASAMSLSMEGSTAPPSQETLDELQLKRLDWLKINESTAAQGVIAGGADTLWRLRPKLFMAVPDVTSLAALSALSREFSYQCWRMETPLFNPDNFNRRQNDIFCGRTMLTVVAIPEEIDVDIPLDGCIEIS